VPTAEISRLGTISRILCPGLERRDEVSRKLRKSRRKHIASSGRASRECENVLRRSSASRSLQSCVLGQVADDLRKSALPFSDSDEYSTQGKCKTVTRKVFSHSGKRRLISPAGR